MSTIVSSYIQDRVSAKKFDTLTAVDASPKAFSVWNGSTMGAIATHNISSITDNAVGQWTPLLTAPFNSSHASWGSAHMPGMYWCYCSPMGQSAGAINTTTYAVSAPGTQIDATWIAVGSAGRLA